MSFSKQWDDIYRNNRHMSIWPWTDLVSAVNKYAGFPSGSRVLELGCGAGANIPFFLSRGQNYYGIDGSEYIINQLREKFPEINRNLITADFTETLPFENSFELIVDRGAITQNKTASIRKTLELVKSKMSDDSVFIGIDWFSTLHSGYSEGIKSEDDPYTCLTFQQGYFKDLGITHFSDKEHLLDLFNDFRMISLEHKVIYNEIPENNTVMATWNITAGLKSE